MAEDEVTATETPASPDPQPAASPAETPVESTPVEAAPAPEETDDSGGDEPTSEALLTNLAEHVQGRESVARKEGQSETHSRMQPFLQRQESAMKNINQGIQEFASDFTEWRDDPTTDQKGLDRLMTKHKETFDTLGQVQLERGGWQGWAGFVDNLGKQSKDMGLAQEFLPRLQHMANGDSDDGFWPDLVEHLTDAAEKKGYEDGRQKGNKETETRHAAEARANGRGKEAPPAKVAAGGGGGGPSTLDEIDEALRTGPTADIDDLLKRRAALTE